MVHQQAKPEIEASSPDSWPTALSTRQHCPLGIAPSRTSEHMERKREFGLATPHQQVGKYHHPLFIREEMAA